MHEQMTTCSGKSRSLLLFVTCVSCSIVFYFSSVDFNRSSMEFNRLNASTNPCYSDRAARFTESVDPTAPNYHYNLSSYSIQLNGTKVKGRSLTEGLALLNKLKRQPKCASNHLNESDVTADLAFVTYSSANHFNECQDALATAQTLFPKHPIYFYDIGLTDDQREELQSLCDVHYVFFNFSKYPEHVKNLRTYAFKPLIIQDMLNKHSTFFWMDASFRLMRTDLSEVYEMALTNGGLVLFDSGVHITALTHPRMFEYFPGNLSLLGDTPMGGGDGFLRNTPKVYENVLHWWFLCALVKDCIAPKGAKVNCPSGLSGTSSEYRGCHRFDQSALDILVANYNVYKEAKFIARPSDKYVIFLRRISHWHVLKKCRG